MTSRRFEDVPVEQTAERVATYVAKHVGALDLASSGEREFLCRLSGERQSRRRLKGFAWGATLSALLVVVGLLAQRYMVETPRPVALSYLVDSREPPNDGYILVPQAAQSVVTFSDGSRVKLESQARGRVLDLSDRGATFTIEDGTVQIDIVPRSSAKWLFKAGPFRVNVHGTSFGVTWRPNDGTFEVSLTSGAITVASPIGGPEIQVHAGQTLRVSLKEQTTTLEPTGRRSAAVAEDSASVERDRASAAVAAALSSAPTTPKASEGASFSHRGWMAALAGNKATEIIAEANRIGVAAVLEQAGSDDLWALANAARYAGQFALASQALLAQRKRFSSSERTREAAFLLGRLSDGDSEDPGKAIGWYDRYLAEARNGAHAPDALGRKMSLLQRWHRGAEAVGVARDYLRRFPSGTYANAARALIQSTTAEP